MSRTWTKRRLAREAAKRSLWMNRGQAEVIVELLFDLIIEGVLRDGQTALDDFGIFSATIWYNETSTNVGLDPYLNTPRRAPRQVWHYLPRFAPASHLKAIINGTRQDVLALSESARPKNWKEILARDLAVHEAKYPCVPFRGRGMRPRRPSAS